MKRLCIYLTYDAQKIIDTYIGYMLGELKKCVDHVAVVCNMTEVTSGADILEEYADEVFYRENIGLDAGGFKDALTKFIGWNRISEFDEVVLINDSLFGPFCSMKDIFDEMDKRPIDFWGLAGHGEYKKEGEEPFPEHIQSYFIAIRSKMLCSSLFQEYWEDLPYYESYQKVVWEHEMQFTSYFSKAGYTYDFYADVMKNNSLNLGNNYRQYRMIPYELIEKRNFPFLKKQQITEERLEEQTQEGVYQAIEYIDRQTGYNVDLIWNNIIRTLNMVDLQKNLHFQYVISDSMHEKCNKKIAVIVCISHQGSAECVLEYLKDSNFEVKVIASNNALLEDYKEYGVESEIIEQEKWAEFLAGYCAYDYVCILHDADFTSDIEPNYIGKSYFFNIWNNLFKSRNHIWGVLDLFERNPRLGLLASPQPNFGKYLGTLGKGWDGKFEEVCRIIEEKGINCQLAEDKPPFRVSQDLWVRGKLLEKLKEWSVKELQYLPYIWTYIAQDAGYFSGIVESSEYAALNEINLQYYLEQLVDLVRSQYGEFNFIYEMKGKISEAALHNFCHKYDHIYVYGTGVYARRYKTLIAKPEAYVVSDGQKKLHELDNIPVKYLSEIQLSDECGFILCMNKKNQTQVIELLKKYGFNNYLCI